MSVPAGLVICGIDPGYCDIAGMAYFGPDGVVIRIDEIVASHDRDSEVIWFMQQVRSIEAPNLPALPKWVWRDARPEHLRPAAQHKRFKGRR